MTHSMSQILKFIVMGSLAALVHGLVLYICVSFFLIAPTWGNVIAFGMAFIVSFIGHSWVTFRQDGTSDNLASHLKRLGKWFTTSLLGFVLNQSLFMVGLAWFGDKYYLIIWFVVTALVTISSFLLGKFWAFKS